MMPFINIQAQLHQQTAVALKQTNDLQVEQRKDSKAMFSDFIKVCSGEILAVHNGLNDVRQKTKETGDKVDELARRTEEMKQDNWQLIHNNKELAEIITFAYDYQKHYLLWRSNHPHAKQMPPCFWAPIKCLDDLKNGRTRMDANVTSDDSHIVIAVRLLHEIYEHFCWGRCHHLKNVKQAFRSMFNAQSTDLNGPLENPLIQQRPSTTRVLKNGTRKNFYDNITITIRTWNHAVNIVEGLDIEKNHNDPPPSYVTKAKNIKIVMLEEQRELLKQIFDDYVEPEPMEKPPRKRTRSTTKGKKNKRRKN